VIGSTYPRTYLKSLRRPSCHAYHLSFDLSVVFAFLHRYLTINWHLFVSLVESGFTPPSLVTLASRRPYSADHGCLSQVERCGSPRVLLIYLPLCGHYSQSPTTSALYFLSQFIRTLDAIHLPFCTHCTFAWDFSILRSNIVCFSVCYASLGRMPGVSRLQMHILTCL
jgi:hypothetical protein